MNNKHVLFIDKLIEYNFNQTKAYQETYPDTDREGARRSASRLLTNVDLQQLLQAKLQEVEIEKYITVENNLRDIRLGKQISLAKGDMSNYARFCELEGKYLAMFTDKHITEDKTPPKKVTKEEIEETKALLNRLEPYVNE